MVTKLEWYGLYREKWGARIVPSAVAHPAKIAYGLTEQIYAFMMDQGWLRAGDWCLDVFGGQAGTGYGALTRGINYVAVEIEPRFFEMSAEEYACPGFDLDFWRRYQKRPAHVQKLRSERRLCPECEAAMKPKTKLKKGTRLVSERRVAYREAHVYRGNLPFWQHKYGKVLPNWGEWIFIRGDSRFLRQVLAGTVDGAVISSPYGTRTVHGQSGIDPSKFAEQGKTGAGSEAFVMDRYGNETGNLDRLPLGAAFLSSPYARSLMPDQNDVEAYQAAQERYREAHPDINRPQGFMGYGTGIDGNLGSMPSGDIPAAALISSAYGGNSGKADKTGHERAVRRAEELGLVPGLGSFKTSEAYGNSDGQIGAMTDGVALSAVVMSTPYADSVNQSAQANDSEARLERKAAAGVDVIQAQNVGGPNSVLNRPQAYGSEKAQLGAMPVGEAPSAAVFSSPFADSLPTDGRKSADLKIARDQAEKRGRVYTDASFRGLTYGDGEEGQLGGMKPGEVASVVTSPTYEETRIEGKGDEGSSGLRMEDGSYVRGSEGWEARKALGARYGANAGQTGNMVGDGDENTFWGATRMILAELYAVLKPGGVLASVTGDYIRDYKRVPFGKQWCAAAEAAGFVLVAHAKAWKVKEHPGAVDLFGEETPGKKVQHMGMFRKMANANNVARNPDDPDAAIESEDVWFLQKPAEAVL